MFGFGKHKSGVNKEFEEWAIHSFLWLKREFGRRFLLQQPVALPKTDAFPFSFNADERTAHDCMGYIAKTYKVKPHKIELHFYDQSGGELRNTQGHRIILENHPLQSLNAGQYHGRNDRGKYEIWLDLSHLEKPEELIATLAHEIAHVKLLGENRLMENDEHLTDLLTLAFGFGVFSANVAFSFEQSSSGWKAQSQGYFSDQEWGFLLAYHAFLRKKTNPDWLTYLRKSLQNDFKRSLRYINDHHLRFEFPPL